MNHQNPKPGSAEKGDPLPPQTSQKTSQTSEAASQDAVLVSRCLAGEAAAWEELYESFHRGIVSSINSLLCPGSHDPNLVDEIAARVWYSMIADDGKVLAQYDPKRGARLITFFRLRARYEIGLMFRSERRRLEREMAAYCEKPNYHGKESGEPAVQLGDFLSTLSAAERCFCGDHLLAATIDSDVHPQGSHHSTTTAWRITRQIREKLSVYLDKPS